MLDVVVRGGVVVDGTGAPRRRADVGILDGRVVEVGDEVGAARRTIDAAGRLVVPGFVDVHTHYDAQVLWDPYLTPSLLHGVTSVIGGNCGFSIAPMAEDAADYLRRLLAKVEGMPLETLEQAFAWDWESTEDYFGRIDGNLAINAGFMVGHSAIRRFVMGPEATQREATADELAAMCELLGHGLAAGGMGFSSSWGVAHVDPNGDLVPSRYASREELLALARVCGTYEGTALEFIPSAVEWSVGSELMAEMSAVAGRHLNWNLLRVSAATVDMCEERLAAGTLARERGGRVVALTMPKPLEFRFSFRTGFLLDTLPGWAKPLSLPYDERRALLLDPQQRRRLEEQAAKPGKTRQHAEWAAHRIVETFTPDTKRFEGRLVAEIAEEQHKSAFDALVDIVCADDLRTIFVNTPPEIGPADWEVLRQLWRDDRALIGGSDAGAHLDLLDSFNLQTWFLDRVVRQEQVVPLEEAVHYFSGAPAALYGLRDRGYVAEGVYADLVVLDEDSVGSEPIRTQFDLPGGAARLYAEPIGIGHVLVNGVEVVHDGEVVDARPGRLLRSGRDSATVPLG